MRVLVVEDEAKVASFIARGLGEAGYTVDVASQGETEEQALANLEEALALHFEEPQATALPSVRQIEVEVSAS